MKKDFHDNRRVVTLSVRELHAEDFKEMGFSEEYYNEKIGCDYKAYMDGDDIIETIGSDIVYRAPAEEYKGVTWFETFDNMEDEELVDLFIEHEMGTPAEWMEARDCGWDGEMPIEIWLGRDIENVIYCLTESAKADPEDMAWTLEARK